MDKQNKQFDFEIISERDYIWNTPQKIETANELPSHCRHCSSALAAGIALIPIEHNKKAKIPGMECRKCRTLFATRQNAIRKLLIDNKYAKAITLNGEKLWNYSFLRGQEAKRQKALKKLQAKQNSMARVEGSIMLVTLKCDDEQIDCIITNNKKVQAVDGLIVMHYSTRLAREIITGVYHAARSISLNGKEYMTGKAYYPSDSSEKAQVFPQVLLPKDMRTESEGGYYSSIKNNNEEIVDVLLFSPFTRRYELARATYNHVDGECFMDIGIFRRFVKEYGNPGLRLLFGESVTRGASFEELRAESILHVYGYSVSEADGLTEAERRALLAEIVDLELLSIPYVVNLLDFFIRTHPTDRYYLARDKWKRDMEYISNYKINPKRFLIMKSR